MMQNLPEGSKGALTVAIKVGNSYVSETAYAQAKARIAKGEKGGKSAEAGILDALRKTMPGWNLSTGTQPFGGSGLNNIGIHPSILRQMANDPEKRLEYEALMIDIQNLPTGNDQPSGTKMIARGFILDESGGLSGWSIVQTETNEQTQKYSVLPRDKKTSWNDILQEQITQKKAGLHSDLNGFYRKA
jgi:hypothetical protein